MFLALAYSSNRFNFTRRIAACIVSSREFTPIESCTYCFDWPWCAIILIFAATGCQKSAAERRYEADLNKQKIEQLEKMINDLKREHLISQNHEISRKECPKRTFHFDDGVLYR